MPAQRWRLTFARTADSPDLAQREQAAAWESLLDAVAVAGSPGDAAPKATPAERPRLVPGATLPVGMTADRELTDLLLPQRWRIGPLRDLIAREAPPGHHLLDLHDVWLGEPSLPSLVVAGDYRLTLAAAAAEPVDATRDLDAAVLNLLASSTVTRTRSKGGRTVVDNLRPLILDVRAIRPDCLWMRLRFDPVLGTGRPEDVVDALAILVGRALPVAERHRERLWLRGEIEP